MRNRSFVSHFLRRMSIVVATLAVGLFVGTASAQAATCSQFPNQAAAQAAANTTDADGDGIYCETLPCPCSTGQPAPVTPTPTPAPAPVPAPTATPTPTPANDADGDGVVDGQDECPTQAGPKPAGCPPPGDTDRDGVLDDADACPTDPAPGTGNGCPDPVRSSKNTQVLCLPSGSGSGDRVVRRKPASCNTLGPDDAFAEALNLAHLRWKSWGGTTATATATEKGFHLPYAKTRVRVVLSRPRPNDCGGFSYTRVKSTSKFGTTKQSLPTVCKG